MIVIGFVVLAAAGTLVRAAASPPEASFDRHLWTTFALNVSGAFLLGWLTGSNADREVIIGVGGLGSLTTFSTFVWQVECIATSGGTRPRAAAFALVTICAGVAAAAVGYAL